MINAKVMPKHTHKKDAKKLLIKNYIPTENSDYFLCTRKKFKIF
jgi:hypothetical protein